MSNVNPTSTNPVVSAGGNFQVNEKTKDGKFVTLSFTSLLIWAGLKSLEGSRAAFNTQFSIAQDKVKIMQELNSLMQLANAEKAKFKSDAKSDDKITIGTDFENLEYSFIRKYPNLIKTGAGVGNHQVTNGNLQAFINNLQTAQSTLSSENEQQSMRTNQAMNRSSGFLQQLQSMMQTAKEALQAASKAGSQ